MSDESLKWERPKIPTVTYDVSTNTLTKENIDVDIVAEILSANWHNYISTWCIHGDHGACVAAANDALMCPVCDAICSCNCHKE